MARDRRLIASLYLRGCLQAEIATEVGLSEATVSRDLKALQQEWHESSLLDIDAAKARELARIDELERTYWQAWKRSCEDAETETARVVETAGGRRRVAQKQTKCQAGDPRFLQGIQWCIERRCKVLGIDAPEKLEHSGGIRVIGIGGIDPDEDI